VGSPFLDDVASVVAAAVVAANELSTDLILCWMKTWGGG